MLRGSQRAWRLAPFVIFPALLCAAYLFWETSRALREAAHRVASEAQVPFRTARLDRSPPAGFEMLNAPAALRDAARFQGRLYLLSSAALFAYDGDGTLRARYRVGLELPPAALVSLSTGVASDASEPELFLATAGEGLLAFNGREFRQLRPEKQPYGDLTAVLHLASGRILLGTRKKGVLAYDGKHLTPLHSSLSQLQVTALAGNEASLWVGTLDQGVWHWHAGQLDRFSEAEGLPDPQVLSLAVAGEAAYVGTPMGVAEFRAGRFQRALAQGFFAQALLVRGETLVVGTLEEGTVEVSLSARPGRIPHPSGQPLPARIERLLEMDGTFYAVAQDGLYAGNARDEGWRRVLEPEGAVLADGNISALDVDAAGRLWVGYFDRGLDIVEAGGARVTHIEDDHVFCVNRIAHDTARGLTAVATANGLALLDAAGKKRQVLGRAEGLIASHVTDVVVGAGGTIVATPAGLTLLDTGGARSLNAFHGLVNNHVYALAAAGDRLLVGTLGGLSVLDGGVVRASYTTANSGLRHNWITGIVAVGEEWFVGTYGAGILHLDTAGRWQSFPDATGPFQVNPNAMVATPSRVYAGTSDRGLYVYDRASGRWTAVLDGLPSANVTAITVSPQSRQKAPAWMGGGFIYVGTDNGLVRFPEQSLR